MKKERGAGSGDEEAMSRAGVDMIFKGKLGDSLVMIREDWGVVLYM